MNTPLPCLQPPGNGLPHPAVVPHLVVGRGGIRQFRTNVRAILSHDPRLQGRLQRDTLAQRIEWTERPGESAMDDVEIFFEREYAFRPRPSDLVNETLRVATPGNPIAAWLDTLEWDGRERLNTVLADHFGAAGGPLLAAYGRRMFVGLVARGRQPGCKLDTVPILSGPQGLRKSSAVAALSPRPEWTASLRLDAAGKDGMQDLVGKWIIELAELNATDLARSGATKAFLSRATDRYRPSYGQRSEDFGRTCCFVGTSNHTDLLQDPTGARRYWPIAIHNHIDVEALDTVRDQLFAEADFLFAAGEPWWLQHEETHHHAAETDAWREPHPWDLVLAAWVERHGTGFTTVEALSGALNKPPERQTPQDVKTVGSVLRGMGMTTVRPREKGRRRVYVWPEEKG